MALAAISVCVQIERPCLDWRCKFVLRMCSDGEVFESKGVRIKRYYCTSNLPLIVKLIGLSIVLCGQIFILSLRPLIQELMLSMLFLTDYRKVTWASRVSAQYTHQVYTLRLPELRLSGASISGFLSHAHGLIFAAEGEMLDFFLYSVG